MKKNAIIDSPVARNGFLIIPAASARKARVPGALSGFMSDPKRSAPNANLLLTLWRHAWDGTQNRRKLRVFCLKGRFYGCVRSEPREHSRARFWRFYLRQAEFQVA